MFITTTYKGYLDGVYGIYCGFKPDNLEVIGEIEVYHPDEGKVFAKDGEYFDFVILKEGESIQDYEEIDDPINEENK